MGVRGTQGQTLSFDTEGTFGTADGSAADILYEEGMTFPTEEYSGVDNNPAGRENWANDKDKPILVRNHLPDSLSYTSRMRVGTDNYDPLTQAGKAGGFGYNTAADTTASLASGVLDTVSEGGAPGLAYLVEQDTSGLYMPVLCATTESTNCDITMQTENGATAGNDCLKMITMYPKNVALSQHAQFVWNTRGENTSGDDWAWTASGCALSGIDTITFEPNQPVQYGFTYHASKVAKTQSSLNAESLAFIEKVPVIDENFEFGFASAPAEGGTWKLTRSVSHIISASIDLNHSAVKIDATGGSNAIGGAQGHFAVPGEPRITVTMIADEDLWDQWSGTNAEKYLHFVQPTSSVGTNPVPAFGFWFPRCYQVAPPVKDGSGDYFRMTVTYKARSAKFESTTTNNSANMAPYFYACGGYKSA